VTNLLVVVKKLTEKKKKNFHVFGNFSVITRVEIYQSGITLDQKNKEKNKNNKKNKKKKSKSNKNKNKTSTSTSTLEKMKGVESKEKGDIKLNPQGTNIE
jgi:hypothetical protein